MNIKEAKEEIKNAIVAYFSKDDFGRYEIPIEKQRPILLMGPPGIGKTAIMEQIASELSVALVSYSMTHHTRQSALGLPFIVEKSYKGQEYSVSEYTMSEIIASVYDMMEESGLTEGILFLDEINCVSETLAPAMLQFLQYKVFGRHRVPDGWIIVTAGNPPEYNSSVREFDIVTWDRLKRIDVEADYGVWKEYAYQRAVHSSIMTYLEIKRGDFYKIESTADGRSFVTARGWADLSDMIRQYEKHGLPVTERLVSQYLQNPKIAKSFAIYYDLFNKYRSDYQVDKILDGKEDENIQNRAKDAKFDERLALLGLLLDAITGEMRAVVQTEQAQSELLMALKEVKAGLIDCKSEPIALLDAQIAQRKELIEIGRKSACLNAEQQLVYHRVIAALEEESVILKKENPDNGTAAFSLLKTDFDKRTKSLKSDIKKTSKKLSNLFAFCENVFGDGQELLILVTELTINSYSSQYISSFGCEEYFAHNKELLFYERGKEIISQLEELKLT